MTNWFDQGGQNYARFRPEYPPELSRFLADIAPNRDMAVDVGCGNGQLTVQLADHFKEVTGIDPSADQIANAQARASVRYLCAPAEKLPVDSGIANLITVAQAAHWLDLDLFYAEARRVVAKGAAIALISYGVHELDADLADRFSRFYHDETGPYWPPERVLVDIGYAGIPFPFEERAAPTLQIRKQWDLDELLGYISTWSAVRRIREAGREDMLTDFAADFTALWGDPSRKRPVAWPINIRAGML